MSGMCGIKYQLKPLQGSNSFVSYNIGLRPILLLTPFQGVIKNNLNLLK
jgi:hypothetical protein